MTDNYLLFGRAVLAPGNTSSITTSYTRLSNGSSYTPIKGDTLVIFLNATKTAAGNSGLSVIPGGWVAAAQSPGSNDNGGVNDYAVVLVRVGGADGTSTDSPVLGVTNTSSVIWQCVTYVIKGVSNNPSPSSPTPTQTGKGGTSATTNAGVLGYSTRVPDEIVFAFFGGRLPTGASSFVWSGSTPDLALTEVAATNNFVAVGIQRQTGPPVGVRPVPTWTGGAGTVTTVMYIGFAPLGDSVGAVQT